MNHRPNCKMHHYNISEDNIEENQDDLVYGNDFSELTPKAWSMQDKIYMLDFI